MNMSQQILSAIEERHNLADFVKDLGGAMS
jgi:hypothetical protein